MAHDSTASPPAQRRRQRLPRHQSPPFAAPILLLVLLLVVPATTAGAIGWPFGWSNNKGGRGQDGDATCEAALLVGDGNGAATAAATAEECVLSSSASSGGGEKQHLATFQARRKHTADLEVTTAAAPSSTGNGVGRTQQERLWHDYLLSEASKAPILNARNWTRLGADTYRCEMAPIAFFSAQIVPVIDVKLEIDPHKRTAYIHARSGKVRKSDEPAAPDAAADGYACSDCGTWNETSFTMKTMNKVTWAHTDDATLRLTSDLSMEVSFEKPAWVWVPNSMMNRVGSLVLKRVVKKALPDFLDRIISGYHEWAATEAAGAVAGGSGGGTVV